MVFKSHKRIISVFAIIILLIAGILIFQSVRDLDNTNIERITYRGRAYIKSTKQTMDANMKKSFDATKTTGIIVKGMEIFDIDNNPNTSTVIFLKTRDENFLLYGLSSGPYFLLLNNSRIRRRCL